MGALKDFLDAVKDVKAEVDSADIFSSKQIKSLSKASMEGIMYFPVIVSDSLSIEDAGIVSKALERQMATFTLSVMTMNPYMNVKDPEKASVGQYIKGFHQNMGVRYDSTDLVKGLNTFIEESFNKIGMEYQIPEGVGEHIAYCIYENVNHNGINKMNESLNFCITEVTNSSIVNDVFGNRVPVTEAKGGKSNNGSSGNNNGGSGSKSNNGSGRYTYGPVHVENRPFTPITVQAAPAPNVTVNAKINTPAPNANQPRPRSDPRQLKHLMDNDVKKSNELVPTLLHMRVYPIDTKNGVELDPIDFVLGIKTTLHPVSSEEMIVNLCRGVKNNNTMFNFIRWTTGEIKFFKDFLFSVNEIKLDALNNSNSANKWWTALKRRKNLNMIKAALGRDRMLPNATIVVTKDEIETIKDQYGYDLSKPAMIHKLMDAYFLIAFVIVDPALQRVTFMFDGRQDAEIQTYATLSREQSTNDRQFKEMLNMLGRRI